jgi:hypothetical protein
MLLICIPEGIEKHAVGPRDNFSIQKRRKGLAKHKDILVP